MQYAKQLNNNGINHVADFLSAHHQESEDEYALADFITRMEGFENIPKDGELNCFIDGVDDTINIKPEHCVIERVNL